MRSAARRRRARVAGAARSSARPVRCDVAPARTPPGVRAGVFPRVLGSRGPTAPEKGSGVPGPWESTCGLPASVRPFGPSEGYGGAAGRPCGPLEPFCGLGVGMPVTSSERRETFAAQIDRRAAPAQVGALFQTEGHGADLLAGGDAGEGLDHAVGRLGARQARTTGRLPPAPSGASGASSASWSYASPIVWPSIQCTGRWPLRTASRRSANHWCGRSGRRGRCGGTVPGLLRSCRPAGLVLSVLMLIAPVAAVRSPC